MNNPKNQIILLEKTVPVDNICNIKINTPLGEMIACATSKGICMLEFINESLIESKLKKVTKAFSSKIVEQENEHLQLLKEQLTEYFEGKRKIFDIPLVMSGTHFQKSAWESLSRIPYGLTRSYLEQAIEMKNPKAVRAVANANGANKICIVLPCHRIIGSDGSLTGYSSGLWRKKWLLDFEKKNN